MEWLHFFTGARLNDDKEFDLQIYPKIQYYGIIQHIIQYIYCIIEKIELMVFKSL